MKGVPGVRAVEEITLGRPFLPDLAASWPLRPSRTLVACGESDAKAVQTLSLYIIRVSLWFDTAHGRTAVLALCKAPISLRPSLTLATCQGCEGNPQIAQGLEHRTINR